MNYVDLHCHTNRSDGVLTPTELFMAMTDWGVQVAAISDHDTLAGYRQLRADAAMGETPLNAPQLIPAVEINSIADRALIELGVELEEGELHILGYGVDPNDQTFEEKLAQQRNARMARLLMIIEPAARAGCPHRRADRARARQRGGGRSSAYRARDGRGGPRRHRPGGVRQLDRPARAGVRAAPGDEVARRDRRDPRRPRDPSSRTLPRRARAADADEAHR